MHQSLRREPNVNFHLIADRRNVFSYNGVGEMPSGKKQGDALEKTLTMARLHPTLQLNARRQSPPACWKGSRHRLECKCISALFYSSSLTQRRLSPTWTSTSTANEMQQKVLHRMRLVSFSATGPRSFSDSGTMNSCNKDVALH